MYLRYHQNYYRVKPRPIILLIFLLFTSMFLQACSSQVDELAVNDPAPDFSLPSSTGDNVSLSDFSGEKPVLLYFHMAMG